MEFERRRRGRRGAGLRKARCVRRKMAKGLGKKSARRACGVKLHR